MIKTIGKLSESGEILFNNEFKEISTFKRKEDAGSQITLRMF